MRPYRIPAGKCSTASSFKPVRHKRPRSGRSGRAPIGHRRPALVSEADFIAVQGIRAVRDGIDSDRCYLLAGLLRCGICGRRLESCWANNRAAYRCRHGHTSASSPHHDRPRNLYIREDRILAHLTALYILLAGSDPADRPAAAAPPSVMDVISHLRAHKITLIYDPETCTLRADTTEAVKITVSRTR
jgi:site-specific DNA recombinase